MPELPEVGTIINAFILGLVQALTEFLPVSSSGHLIIFHDILDFRPSSELAFNVALHTGTFLAILVFFWRQLLKERFLWKWIIISCIPAGLVGYFLEDFIDLYLRNLWLVVVSLLVVGCLFLVIEKRAKQTKILTAYSLQLRTVLFIGLAQILALVPGVSRSGITTVAGMAASLKRDEATRFSFLVALPIFAAASLKKSWDLSKMNIPSEEKIVFLIGLIVSFIFGWLVIKWLLRFFQRHSLKIFAYYRFVLAGILIIYLIYRG